MTRSSGLPGGERSESSLLQGRRSVIEMEKALQSSIDQTSSSPYSKTSLYKEVVKASAGNHHLTVSPVPSQSLKSTPKKKIDMKLICPHGI